MSRMLRIDGSIGEGGGQVLRSALTLSAALGRSFRMEKIRAGREKPGLAAQHLACVHAAARLSGARVSGDRAGSLEVSFSPGKLRPGRYSSRVRTAGSAALVAQTAALPLALAGGESRLTVGGGTHVPWAPTAGYLTDVWAPAAESLGLRTSLRLERAGYYPNGGGELVMTVHPARRPLMPLEAVARGSLRRLRARLAVSRLPGHVVERCRGRAEALIVQNGLFADWEVLRLPAASPGVCLELVAEFGVLSAGFGSLGRPGKPAEKLAEEAVGALAAFLASGAAVDHHLADQLVVPLALAPGTSSFSVDRLTGHLLTVVQLVRCFLPEVEISVEGQAGGPGTVQVAVPG
jgi:RNA 3'-terminal phosphate cyclase (ATP)